MLTFHLVNSLNLAEESDWNNLLLNVLGNDVHKGRAKGFCLAREALKRCFEEKRIPLKVTELVLNGFNTLKGHETFTLSLSHTPEWGAALIGERQQFLSVGIDIEPLGRVVKPMILERISHPEDQGMPPIHLWSLKEATFKALMNTGKFVKPEEFSSIQIRGKRWKHDPSQLEGEWDLEEQQGLVVARAWIRNQGSFRPVPDR